MNKLHRRLCGLLTGLFVLSGTAAAAGGLPNLSAYPTRIIADGQVVEDGPAPRYVGGEVLLPLRSVLGVPEGSARPVVIVLYGSHPVRHAAENRYDLGFSELVGQLADADGTNLYTAQEPSTLSGTAKAEPVDAGSTLANTAGAFRLPGNFTRYDLTRISWEQAGASVNVPVGTPALALQPGETEHIPQYGGTELLRYSTFTPLGTLRLDLRAFAGVDLSALQEITLTFGQPSGSIMLREIEAV